MEFKNYLQIIKKYKTIFSAIWGGILILVLFTIYVQPTIYEGEKVVFVMRHHKNMSANVSKEYDYYYQMEVDKKIANIIIKLLEDKYLLDKSFNSTEKNKNKITIPKSEKEWVISHLKGEVLEGGYVKIKVSGHDKEVIKQIGNRLVDQLKGVVSKLGTDETRILKLGAEPMVIEKQNSHYLLIVLGALFGGLLIAIFVVLTIYYWEEE